MKILFIETKPGGHHMSYLRGLTDCLNYESVVIAPPLNETINARQIIYNKNEFPTKSFKDYLVWIKFIEQETINNEYDVIHFLDGDTIMRFFGIGFQKIKARKVIITYHHYFNGIFRMISYKMMCVNRVAVVHTKKIEEKLKKIGIKHVRQVNYPAFSFVQNQRLMIWDNNEKLPVLGALGGIRRDKGLDILLKALEKVNQKYKLLIAGTPIDISKEYIEKAVNKISGQAEVELRSLTDDEFKNYLDMVDIFVLPYRHEFDGASGPLVEGVARGKMIIGPSHGSLGQIITENHIGKIFETENTDSLANVINQALQENFEYDCVAKKYQQTLTVEGFQNSYYGIYSE